ncbi:hypothetical protein G3M48_003861 [Beauveria asiatica]|uniref:Uncharacterized protein n=1 Tax=Beauveria asiatica TaxID=1069075 RepID=A0AAW0RV62_9HYPO
MPAIAPLEEGDTRPWRYESRSHGTGVRLQKPGSRRNRGIGLRNIRPAVQTRYMSICSVTTSRPSKSWW